MKNDNRGRIVDNELYKQAVDYLDSKDFYKVGVVNVKLPAIGSVIIINDEHEFVVIGAKVDEKNKNKFYMSLGFNDDA